MLKTLRAHRTRMRSVRVETKRTAHRIAGNVRADLAHADQCDDDHQQRRTTSFPNSDLIRDSPSPNRNKYPTPRTVLINARSFCSSFLRRW